MKVVVVEDSELIRRQIVALLLNVPGVMVVGQASAEAPAIALLRHIHADVVLLDLWLSPGHGLNVLKQLRRDGSNSRVFVLTHLPQDQYRDICMQMGADGFFDKARLDHDLPERLQREAWLDSSSPEVITPLPMSPVAALHRPRVHVPFIHTGALS